MSVSQTEFSGALLNAEKDVPKGLLDAGRAPAGRRFSVYRNNVIVSLAEALETAFPLICKLLGRDSFTKLATLYVREHPPTSPLMMFYGDLLPDFLANFSPLSHIGYLPDCARLDLAMRRSYHAADAIPIDPLIFQDKPEKIMALKLSLAPSTIVIRSPWPIFDIWRVNFDTDAAPPRPIAQDVIITRPQFDPSPHLLEHGVADWLERMHNGVNFGEAHEQTLKATPAFDLETALAQALQTGALTEFKTKDY
ncbi:MAG: DNA-binding domain-containing protein [Paracoccaceae bacterium]|nr:DNA-binding domain-containing protein [Paracoccaceae bacterium]